MVKFHNQRVVPLRRSLVTKPPQTESKLQPYEIMKQCPQISKCNGCRASFDNKERKLYILGGNELEWFGKGTTTNKQSKSKQHVLLYVIIMSRARFRVNLHSIVA